MVHVRIYTLRYFGLMYLESTYHVNLGDLATLFMGFDGSVRGDVVGFLACRIG